MAKETVKPTVTVEPTTISIGSSLSVEGVVSVQSDVIFLAEYSKDYKGEKPLFEGTTHTVAKDVADLFVKKGFGKIIE